MSSKQRTKPPWKKIYAALPFVCKYCRGLFPDFKFYRRHIRSHESRYRKFWHSSEWRAARRFSMSWVEDASDMGGYAERVKDCNGKDMPMSNIIKFARKHTNGGPADCPVNCQINGCKLDTGAERAIQQTSTSRHRNLPIGITVEQAALIAHYQRMQLSKHKAPERYSDSEDCSDSNHSNSYHDAMLHDLGHLLSGRQQLEQCRCSDCFTQTRQTVEEPIMPSYRKQRHLEYSRKKKHPGEEDRNHCNPSPPNAGGYTYPNSMGPVMLPCPHCPVSFDHADRLTLHIKNHYTGNKTVGTPGDPAQNMVIDEQGTDKIAVVPDRSGHDMKLDQQISNGHDASRVIPAKPTQTGLTSPGSTPQQNVNTTPPNMCANVSNNNNAGICYQGNKNVVAEGGQFILKCQECNKEFSSETDLKVHHKYHLSVKGYQSVTRKHSSAAYLTGDDQTSPPKPYPCVYCPKTFTYWSSLKTHEFSHTGESPFVCELCDEKFMQCSELKLHEKTHLGANPFKCGKCDRLFKHRPSLTTHERTHHGEDGKNICPVCLKTFSVGSNLRDHLRIHTGERPYQCASCGRGFIQKSHLRKHVMIHTGERPFRCTFCNKGFTQRGDVRRHEKIHRKVK